MLIHLVNDQANVSIIDEDIFKVVVMELLEYSWLSRSSQSNSLQDLAAQVFESIKVDFEHVKVLSDIWDDIFHFVLTIDISF